jgi:hypothetical protein
MSLEITPAQKQSRPESGQLAIVPAVKSQPRPDIDALIYAYYLMFARAPRTPDPDPEGFYSLGEIGQNGEKDWERLTPYSLARRAK